jgi:molybdate transport system permease protein
VLLDALVHLPLVVPPVVTGWLLLLAFAPAGPIGAWLESWFGVSVLFRWTGAAIAAARDGAAADGARDPAVDRRRSTGGSNRRRAPWARGRADVFDITLPLSLPGVIAGMVLGFARALGEFGATITFVSNVPGETQTLPLAIYAALQTPGGEGWCCGWRAFRCCFRWQPWSPPN